MVPYILVNMDLGNGLVPGATKPLTKSIVTYNETLRNVRMKFQYMCDLGNKQNRNYVLKVVNTQWVDVKSLLLGDFLLFSANNKYRA